MPHIVTSDGQAGFVFSLVVRTSSLMTTPRAGSRSQGRDRRVVGKSAANVEPDVRVFDVLWDEQTDRDWRQANQESSTEIFSESPCEERFIRQKKGGDHGSESTRTQALCDAMWRAGTYDQLPRHDRADLKTDRHDHCGVQWSRQAEMDHGEVLPRRRHSGVPVSTHERART